jgi:hypothetical protein
MASAFGATLVFVKRGVLGNSRGVDGASILSLA